MPLNDVRLPTMAVLALAICTASATAQTIGPTQPSPDPTHGRVSLGATYDFTNAYMFRGLRQDDTRLIMFPFVEAKVDLHDDNDGITDAALHIGTWNSLNTGLRGAEGPSGKLWYESRFYSALDFTFGPGITVGGGYTAYPSPNNSFSTVKEFEVRVSAEDAVGLVLRPHALLAFEFDTSPGFGQADGGLSAGTYLELGVAPGLVERDFSIVMPVRVGISLNDYYELAGVDHKFGYLSLGAVATVPLTHSASWGTWDVHGGFEFQSLGDTPEAFNGGDQSKLLGIVGLGFSY